MLEVLLPLDRVSDIGVMLCIDQALQLVTSGETLDNPLAMLPGALRNVAGHADVQHAIAAVCHEIDPATLHPMTLARPRTRCNRKGDGRVKPGHDEVGGRGHRA